ncbi:MAG: hypothetical protein ACR2QE_07235 [Acidimicrobiales bacterium]
MPDSRLLTLIGGGALVIAVIIAAVAALIGLSVPLAILLALVVAAVVGVLVYRLSGARAADMLHARPLVPGEQPRLDNLLDVLCVNNGYERPDVMRIDSAARNSAVLTRNGATTVVITDGLLGSLDYMALEALLAHQLAAGSQSDLDYRSRMLGLVSLLPGSMQDRVADAMIDQPPVFETDLEAAQVTRYPPGQVELFTALAEGDNRVGGVSEAGAGLWLANPLGAHAGGVPHPALEDRIAFMREV